MSMGGCSYVFHIAGGFDIVGTNCASSPITISAAGCTVTIGPQSGFTGLTYANAGSGKLRGVTTGGEAKNLKVTVTGAPCPSQGTFSTPVYKGVKRFAVTTGFWVE